MDTFTVYGNWGTLIADAETGIVLSYNHDNSDWEKPGDGYEDITRFDVERWQQDHPDSRLTGDIDIINIGYWYKGGYESPIQPDDALGAINHMPDDNTH